MKLILDTNIFLEVLLVQEKSAMARELLSKTDEHEFSMSDYSLHSIGLLLFHRREHRIFQRFLRDMIADAGVRVVSLLVQDMENVIEAAESFNLDFDDAYQYVTAKKLNLEIVSLDSDFDRTEKGRKTPAQLVV